jgi:rhodanese-related sulfurtransferase
MAKVTYIEPEELAKLLIESPDDVAVIDVREADYTVLNGRIAQ